MDLIRALADLFEKHSPETLMAFFGAVTSIQLFYLAWWVLRHFFGLQARSAKQEETQERMTAILLKSLVEALVTESGHLRRTLDSYLEESLRCEQTNTQTLEILLSRSEEAPAEVLRLLKPEFEHLHEEISQVEARLAAKVLGLNQSVPAPAEAENTQP